MHLQGLRSRAQHVAARVWHPQITTCTRVAHFLRHSHLRRRVGVGGVSKCRGQVRVEGVGLHRHRSPASRRHFHPDTGPDSISGAGPSTNAFVDGHRFPRARVPTGLSRESRRLYMESISRSTQTEKLALARFFANRHLVRSRACVLAHNLCHIGHIGTQPVSTSFARIPHLASRSLFSGLV